MGRVRVRVLVLAVASALSVASATPYQKSGVRGGYSDRKIGKRTHFIRVQVNGLTSRGTATEHAYRRADELCPDGYDVLDEGQMGHTDVVSNQYATTVASKPEVTLRVKCHRAERVEHDTVEGEERVDEGTEGD